MDYTFVGKRITQLLLEKNISEYKLSTEIGRCCSYVQKITSYKSHPSLSGLFSILEYLDVTPAEFFTTPSELNPELASTLENATAGLDEEDFLKLIDYAKLLQKAKK